MVAQLLSLKSEPLEEFREMLDVTIRNMVNNMVKRDLMSGTVTAKIKVELVKTDKPGTVSMEIEPEVGMKIGAQGKAVCKKQKGILMKFSEFGDPVIGEKQMDIDDYIEGGCIERSAWADDESKTA